ncbi:succinate dehydrogenase assembly factor 2 [Rhodovulum sp. DZ06]|uniref:FAD assembly factor SdhE n=1 Tax=Rhodovulum sp. DZ06 TaxID=3425126 RepID=UPI003D35209D
MSETPQDRLKRLRIRGWRRGTKEMDLLLGPFCDALAEGRVACDLDALEVFMNENDQDLYQWISGGAETPAALAPMVAVLRDFHRIEG